MKYINISHDKKNVYILKENEKVVFFLYNRKGEITFKLAGANAEAHIFSIVSLSGTEVLQSQIRQIHSVPHAISSFIGRAIISDNASLDWQGCIHIQKNAHHSDGHQEMRSLLLSPEASTFSFPSLEIENNDVHCGHAATASAPNKDSLFFLQSRGFSEEMAQNILVEGFIQDILEKLPTNSIQKEKLLQLILTPIL